MALWPGLTLKVLLLMLQFTIGGFTISTYDVPTTGEKLRPQPTYFIMAPNHVRPSEVVQVVVSIYQTAVPELTVHAVIRRDGNEVTSASDQFRCHSTHTLQMKVPDWAPPGNYSLRVEGITPSGGYLFVNESVLTFHPKHVSVFIQTSKWFYLKRQTVRFRIVALTQDLLPVKGGSIHIYIKDARGRIVRRWISKQLFQGLYEGELKLNHPCIYGWWTILVEGFGYHYTQRFRTENHYRERVDVNLTMPAYVKEHEYGLGGLLMANLSSGYPLKGSAVLELVAKPPGAAAAQWASIKRTVPYFEGVTPFLFPLAEIGNTTRLTPGTTLQVTATAEDFYNSGQLSASVQSELLPNHVYLAFIGGTVRTFKPGLPFNVYVAVYEADGVPLSRLTHRVLQVDVSLTMEGGQTSRLPEKTVIIPDNGIVRYNLIPGPDVTSIIVRVKCGGAGVAGLANELTASRHVTRHGHYLSVSTSTEDIEADHYLVLTVRSTAFLPEVHYVVMTGGRIVLTNTLYMTARQRTLALVISREMIPESRVVVYGMLGDGEVLADSLSFYVRGIRNDGVKVRINKGKDFSLRTVELTGLADPGARIAFSAMNYEFYARGGNRQDANVFFTTHAVEEEYLTYSDHVNTSMRHTWLDGDSQRRTSHFTAPSYAIDANNTFIYNGLTVMTDAYVGRIEGARLCNSTLGFLPCFRGSCYERRQSCDGVRQCADGADEMGCPDPHFVEPRRPGGLMDMAKVWPHMDLAAWGWKSHFTKPDGRMDLRTDLPARPATWVVGAFSLHPERGLAFTEHPARVDTTRPFYMVIEADKIAVHGEHLGIRVVVFNFHDEAIEALITLPRSEDYDFVRVPAAGRVRSYDPDLTDSSVQTMVHLRSQESRMVYLPIAPTRQTGKIRVTVTGETAIGRAVVTKTISLRMEGIRNIYHTPYFINLVSQGSVLVPDLEIPVPEIFYHPDRRQHLYVPGSARCTVSIVGDVMGPGFTSSHLTMQGETDMFMGDGEDYVFNLAFNMNWVRFLKITSQISAQQLNEVLNKMNLELMTIVAYIKPDGGVANRRKRSNESVWLTGFTLQTLAFAADAEYENILYIDVDLLNLMASWLVAHQNRTTGAFHAHSEFLDLKMQDLLIDPAGNRLNIQETAYAVIGLSEAQDKLTGVAQSAAEASRKLGADFLARHFELLTEPFDVCLVAMALHVTNHRQRGRAFNAVRDIKRQGEFTYWSSADIPPDPTEIINTVPIRKPRAMPTPAETSALQATGYALMLYLRNNLFTEAEPIMQWIQSRRRYFQFFGSTQDTIVAMQALREYGERLTNRDLYSMKADMEATSTPDLKHTFLLQRGNFHDFQTFSVPKVYGSVKSAVVGTGLALLNMRTEVNVEYPWQLRNPAERSYDLTVDNLLFYGRNASNFYIEFCFRWTRTDLAPVSGATVLEVEVPTGFYVRKNVLRAQVKINNHVKRARYTSHSVVLYMDSVGPEKTCEAFRAERWWPVSNGTIQHRIRIMDTTNPAFQNSSLYETWQLFSLNICQVCGSFQCPYCPFYNSAPSLLPPRAARLLVAALCALLTCKPAWSLL